MVRRSFLYAFILCHFVAALKLVTGYGVTEQLWLEVIYPSDVAFAYKIRPARDFGDIFVKSYHHVRLVATEPKEACGMIRNGKQLKGQVAFVKRGGCSFLSKSINAELHGSIAVVISDSDPDENRSFVDMIADGTEREEEVGIPAFFMLGKDGRMISDSLRRHDVQSAIINIPVNFTGTATIKQPPWDFW